MVYTAINLKEKPSKFSEHWSPRVAAELSNFQFRVVELERDFISEREPFAREECASFLSNRSALSTLTTRAAS